jgi:hypothetical protein
MQRRMRRLIGRRPDPAVASLEDLAIEDDPKAYSDDSATTPRATRRNRRPASARGRRCNRSRGLGKSLMSKIVNAVRPNAAQRIEAEQRAVAELERDIGNWSSSTPPGCWPMIPQRRSSLRTRSPRRAENSKRIRSALQRSSDRVASRPQTGCPPAQSRGVGLIREKPRR